MQLGRLLGPFGPLLGCRASSGNNDVVDQEDAESIEFAVNGKSYTIDLGKKNADEFHKLHDKYVAGATKVGGATTRKPARGSKEDPTAIRGWGKENGSRCPHVDGGAPS